MHRARAPPVTRACAQRHTIESTQHIEGGARRGCLKEAGVRAEGESGHMCTVCYTHFDEGGGASRQCVAWGCAHGIAPPPSTQIE